MSYYTPVAIQTSVKKSVYSETHQDFGPLFDSKIQAYDWLKSQAYSTLPKHDRLAVMDLTEVGKWDGQIPF